MVNRILKRSTLFKERTERTRQKHRNQQKNKHKKTCHKHNKITYINNNTETTRTKQQTLVGKKTNEH